MTQILTVDGRPCSETVERLMRTLSAGFCATFLTSQLLLALPTRAESFTVAIKDFEYSPSSLTINRGDTVKFVNEDAAPHTVTPFKDADFTGIAKLARGESATITFETSGKQKYYCDIHPMMKGSVLVK